MMRVMKTAGGLAAIATMLLTTAATARTCWLPAEADAAQVRELQSMLMVAALRCRAEGVDILADYDAMVTAERPLLATANASLRGHFDAAGATGEADYDHFATALANAYGDGGRTQIACGVAAALARDAAGASDAADLLRIASAAAIPPRALSGGVCAGPAAPQPVTLAPQVVAALVTLAALQPQHPPAQRAAATQLASSAP